MNETSVDWSLQKFGIGQPVPRTEDPHLVRGEGRYTDDVNLPGQAYAAIVRSRHAHGVIRKIDLEAARAMPGVLAAYTAADLSGYGGVVTHLFRNGDPYIETDVVYGVKKELIVDFERKPAGAAPTGENVTIPFNVVRYDFVLQQAQAEKLRGAA